MSIHIEDLTVRFKNSVTAIDHADLDIPNGIFGLLGENGAGKTTLMRVLTTVLKPTNGMVTLDGILYSEGNYEKIQRKIGYKNQFILKGGMLVAAMVGLDARATMDLDATIKGTNVSVEDVEMIISQIISIPLDDGVSFRVKRISEIMEEADYPGVRVSMETKFDGVITPLKIDISTGDVITPREIKYKFNLMLEDRTIEVWAYNLETVLAEKLETVVSRNVTNTRMRDFYDIYILQKLYGEQLQKQVLWTALVATAKKRGTLDLIEAEDIREIFDEIESSPVMETLWKTYQKNYSYAADISWHAIVKSICALYGSILENMYDT